jgi:hypothetical protein
VDGIIQKDHRVWEKNLWVTLDPSGRGGHSSLSTEVGKKPDKAGSARSPALIYHIYRGYSPNVSMQPVVVMGSPVTERQFAIEATQRKPVRQLIETPNPQRSAGTRSLAVLQLGNRTYLRLTSCNQSISSYDLARSGD